MIAPLIVSVVAVSVLTLMSFVRMIHRLSEWDSADGNDETELAYAAGFAVLMAMLSIAALIGAGMALDAATS